MKRFVSWLVLCGALATLYGCSRAPFLYVLNNTGRTFEIVLASNDGDRSTSELDRGWLRLPYLIDSGKGREVLWSRDEDIEVLIRADDCRAWYRFARLSETMSSAYFVVRIERDGLAYLVASDFLPNVDGEISNLRAMPNLPVQPEGFPIAPSERCLQQ